MSGARRPLEVVPLGVRQANYAWRQSNMSETEFLRAVATTLALIEDTIDAADIDAECSQTALVLTVEFAQGAKILFNAQTPMRQLWMAWRGGALHFALNDAAEAWRWIDTRSGQQLDAALSAAVSDLIGRPLVLKLRPA